MKTPLTIKETQTGLIKKEFSAVELVDSYLARIKKDNREINAFLTVTENKAYEQAKRVDKILSDNDIKILSEFPLLGVTVAHKDLFLTKGVRTTAASKVLADYIPPYSATVVTKLEKAGAIMLGKTNCDAWAHGSSGENSDYGPTKNPWQKEYVAGGSSSGSAAALAAGFSLTATGTDTCGSIRVPANFCCQYGLKPTYGAISRYGVIAMASSLDTVGFLAHSVADIEKLFQLTAGGDGHDATVKDFDYQSVIKKKYKIGLPQEFFTEGLDREVARNIDKAIKYLEKAGHEIRKISLPHTKNAISVYYILQPAEVSSNLGRYDGIRFGSKRGLFSDEAKRRIMLGTYVLSAGYYDAYYLQAMKVRTVIKEEIDAEFEKVDFILAPVSPTPAFKIGEKSTDPLKMYLTDIFAATANLSGIPALAVPFNFSGTGLPLGFQLMGPRFSEPDLFNLAASFEKITEYQPENA